MVYLKSIYPPVPPLPETNFHNLLFNRPDQSSWPEYSWYIDAATGEQQTQHEFYERVRDGATALGTSVEDGGALGLVGVKERGAEGALVGIMSDNSMDYMVLIHSLLVITTPFALFSSYSTPYELSHALRLTQPTHLFTTAKLLPTVLLVAKGYGLPLSAIFLLGPLPSTSTTENFPTFSSLISTVQAFRLPRLAVRPAKKDTLAYLVFSSGTSGLPKAVCLSHGNLLYATAQSIALAAEVARIVPPPKTFTLTRVLAFLPLSHSYGLHAYAFRAFLRPTTLVMISPSPSRQFIPSLLSAIPKYQITHINLIPSVVHQIVNYPQVQEMKDEFASLETVTCGAAHLDQELANKLTKLMGGKVQLGEGYGMSEATIGAIMQPYPGTLSSRGKHVPGSAGLLIPGMEARIVRVRDGNDDGKKTPVPQLGVATEELEEADVGEIGELYIRSENIALGYWGNERATRESFVDGWLKTGDRFWVDADGYFFFADRAKDILKISGQQVSPLEIEQVLLSHPENLIIDTTVAGVSGLGRTTDEKVPKAWVVLSVTGRDLGGGKVVERLMQWAERRLSRYKMLRGGIEVIDEIPKLPTGKVLRRVLQEKHEKDINTKRTERSRL